MNALNPPKRVLLIKLRHHGDVLLSTPLVRVLKQRFPECEVDYLVYAETAAILSCNRDINQLFTLDRSLRGIKKLLNRLTTYRQLSTRHYDWILHLSDQWHAAVLVKLLAPDESVGFAYPKRNGKWWPRLFTRLVPLAPRNTLHTVEQNLMALSTLGLEATLEEKHCSMAFDAKDQQTVQQQLAACGLTKSYILVHPTSRWFFKCWENERFAKLIQALADDGHSIVLTAAPKTQEIEMVNAILRDIRSERVYSLAGKLSLTSLAAAIDGARLFIGVDSAPMHMAAALGKDTLALFGPSNTNAWHPWMTRYILIHAADYGPLLDPDSIDTRTNERYLKAIPVEPVLTAARELLRTSHLR